ncbi:hypothetical protein T11_2772 [Trichinella zimbabwensis]|uniref:Uncharacterized protein n=1 Tax=Trichinella zimbabwensis TaxID=268475 RepID=A0A0V1H551_9BILA|nr:hypothetical protein T11_2772 [Trichinella zimbabwensis]
MDPPTDQTSALSDSGNMPNHKKIFKFEQKNSPTFWLVISSPGRLPLILHEIRPATSHSRRELLRLHDEINSHLLEICALGKNVDASDTGTRLAIAGVQRMPTVPFTVAVMFQEVPV